jgi:hypothetical protein
LTNGPAVANAGHQVNTMNKTLIVVCSALLLLGVAGAAEAHIVAPTPGSILAHPTDPSQWDCEEVAEGPHVAVPPCHE